MTVACLVGICIATITSLLLALGYGCLTPLLAACALLAGALAGVGAWQTTPLPRCTIATKALFVIFALFALRAFCWVAFNDGDSLKVLSPNNLGDLSLHLTYINYFCNGAPFWPVNPIFAGAPLHYPLGLDLFNALLKLVGVDAIRGFIWVGLAGSAMTAYALFRWGGTFAVAGFLFNGGLEGWRYFEHFRFADYNQEAAWKSIPLAMFVTQRGLLYAIPVGLLLLAGWRTRWFNGKNAKLSFPVELLLFSTLPLFHLHTFLFLGCLLSFWSLFCARETKLGALKLLACSIVPATFSVSLVTGLFQSHSTASIIHVKPGWMQGDQNPVAFWFLNFGALPLFIAVLIYSATKLSIRSRDEITRSNARGALAYAVPAAAIFLIACFVMFAPWEWDNTKLMIWSYFIVLPFLWEMVISKLSNTGRTLSCVVLFFSGFISLLGGLDRSHGGYEIARRSELDAVAFSTKSLAVKATFAAYPTYNHPLLLTGHKLVEGYDGHLFSHGIDYQARLNKLNALLAGAQDWRKISGELGVRYLFWGGREKEHYPDSVTPWKTTAKLVAQGSWGEIYDLAP